MKERVVLSHVPVIRKYDGCIVVMYCSFDVCFTIQ